MAMNDFKLSASLAAHDDDVRAVLFPSPNAIISASRDATVRLWKVVSSPPPTFDATITSHGSAFINAVAYLPPSTEFSDGLIVSGGKDTIIEVRQPGKAPEDNAEALLLGHSNNVCALDVDPSGKFIVSGGWDGQARIWLVGRWNCDAILEGHQGSVLAVLAYDSETIITGSADQLIRVFHKSSKLLRTIKGSNDVVRALCRVPKDHPSGADFTSASNDGIIRFWTVDGRQVAKVQGHESFIYSLASLPTGELVSSGEDRTVRIWRGDQCVQTITLPAISVWGVATCAENGDIVAGASDRVVRVFTRAPERIASAKSIQLFEESLKESSIPQQQLPEINKEKLPGPEFLQLKAGTKEGQVQMIREGDGSVTAHQWSVSQQQWVSIGAVVDAVGSSGKKVNYHGKDYDFVFDVDIEDGKPPLKLPYNLSQNPYEAATKFIQDNELPITYLDTVADFITENTKGASLGPSQPQGPPPTGHDPWGTESRYRPGGAADFAPAPQPAAPQILPQKTYLSILVARYDGIQKKIEELNSALLASGDKSLSLNPTDITTLRSLIANLSKSSTTSTALPTGALPLALRIVTTWPYSTRLPGLDLLRLLSPSPAVATYTHPITHETIIDLLIASSTEQDPPAENHIMMAVRALVNLFQSADGRTLALRAFEKVKVFVEAILQLPGGVGGGKGSKAAVNRNLGVAIVTLWINYAVLFSFESSAADPTMTADTTTTTADKALTLLPSLLSVLSSHTDAETLYRALVALGTLLAVDEEVKIAAVEVYDVQSTVKMVVGKSVDSRVSRVGGEIGVMF